MLLVARPRPFCRQRRFWISIFFLDFDIGISDFPFWLRPQAALGVRVRVRVGLHAVCLTLVRADAGAARPRLDEAGERLSVECSIGSGMHSVVQCEANAEGTHRRAVVTNRLGAR